MNFFKITFATLILMVSFFSRADENSCLKNSSNLFNQATDYFNRKQFLLATHLFSTASLLSCSEEDKQFGKIRWAHSLYELGEISEGNIVLTSINETSKMYGQKKLLMAWYQPELVSNLPLNDINRFLLLESEYIKLKQKKDPWIAGTLSAFLPGLGQIYNGTYQSAAFTFILNALFLTTTLELQKNNLDAAAITSGVVFSVLYFGNISSAVHGSKTINSNFQKESKLNIQKKIFPELFYN